MSLKKNLSTFSTFPEQKICYAVRNSLKVTSAHPERERRALGLDGGDDE